LFGEPALPAQIDQRIPARRRKAEQSQTHILDDRVFAEQSDDLIGACHAEMRAVAAWHFGDVLAEQGHRTRIGGQFARDQIEQCCLAGAVRTDNQAALAGLDIEVDAAGDVQAAEGF
jgi:hypothetical protein